MKNDLTRAQLQWLVKLFANGGSVKFSTEHDRRELRPLNTLTRRNMVKMRENRSSISYSVTNRGRRQAAS